MPIQKPGRSKQDYQTPPEFLAAVKKRLHTNVFGWDLAASKENTACEFGWYDEEQDSLKQNWHEIQNGWMWLNPPFSNIAPWVYKASDEAWKGAFIAMLVPASVGANWWRDFVHDDAHVLFLNGRLTFVGAEGPYPKDCALLLYQPAIQGGYDTWNWKR
jgi:phage N-6-adenine-methyltransferase